MNQRSDKHSGDQSSRSGGQDLWRRYTKGVRPLDREASPPPEQPAEQPAPSSAPGAAAKTEPPDPAARRPGRPAPAAAPQPLLPLTPGLAPGLDKRTLQRLRRGLMAPEGRLDLHNMTQDEAHQALDRFIRHGQATGRRCVLVITGKGRSSEGMIGVLKQQVPLWLNEPALRVRVLAFTYATPTHGGDGALFVLLKRLGKTGQRDPRNG